MNTSQLSKEHSDRLTRPVMVTHGNVLSTVAVMNCLAYFPLTHIPELEAETIMVCVGSNFDDGSASILMDTSKSGDGVTHVVPDVDGYSFPHLTKCMNIAVYHITCYLLDHITSYLLDLLPRCGYALKRTADFETLNK